MQFMNNQERDLWLTSRKLPGPSAANFVGHTGATRKGIACFDIKASATMSLARALSTWSWAGEPDSVLVAVAEFGIWPSSENLSLYYLWRQHAGDRSHLEQSSNHLFLRFEGQEMLNLVHMAIVFGWGFAAYSSFGSNAVMLNHDGQLVLWADTPERLNQVPAWLVGERP